MTWNPDPRMPPLLVNLAAQIAAGEDVRFALHDEWESRGLPPFHGVFKPLDLDLGPEYLLPRSEELELWQSSGCVGYQAAIDDRPPAPKSVLIGLILGAPPRHTQLRTVREWEKFLDRHFGKKEDWHAKPHQLGDGQDG